MTHKVLVFCEGDFEDIIVKESEHDAIAWAGGAEYGAGKYGAGSFAAFVVGHDDEEIEEYAAMHPEAVADARKALARRSSQAGGSGDG